MKWNLITLLFASLFLFHQELLCQRERFNSGIIVGFNLSELEGTELTDYIGWNTGIMTTMSLSKKHQIGMELLFSQNGEYILPEYYPKIEYGQIRLNHLEIPLHFDWLVTVKKKDKIQNIIINAGVAYVKLLNYSAKGQNGTDVTNQIVFNKREAFHLQSGLTYKFTKNIGLNFKATVPIQVEDWTIAIRAIYRINK